MAEITIPTLPPFDLDDENTAERWERYKKSFEYYAAAMRATTAAHKKGLFLHVGGTQLQEVFETFNFGDVIPTFELIIEKFDERFTPLRNSAYERHVFFNTVQKSEETTDLFLSHLRHAVKHCGYGDTADDHIRDQFINGCSNSRLRRRLLREQNLTLSQLVTIARAEEVADLQAQSIENKPSSPTGNVNQIRAKTNRRQYCHKKTNTSKPVTNQSRKTTYNERSSNNIQCTRCGIMGHKASECRCSRDAVCRKCGKIGHFDRCCRTTNSNNRQPSSGERDNLHFNPQRRDNVQRNHSQVNTNNLNSSNNRTHKVQHLTSNSQYDNQLTTDDYICALTPSSRVIKIDLILNDIVVKFIVDTGSLINIINRVTWDKCNKNGINLHPTSKRVFAYGNTTPLGLIGECEISIQYKDIKHSYNFVIVENDYPCILGLKPSEELGIITINVNNEHIYALNKTVDDILNRHADIFKCLGKLKNTLIHLELQDGAKIPQLPVRRIPYLLRADVEAEIERLIQMGVVEPVPNPTDANLCINPLRPVFKKDGSIRLCLAAMALNSILKRQKCLMPLIEDIVQEMQGFQVGTELDFNEAFMQLELDEESRNLVAFATESGTYRFTRLIYGINNAPEIFQATIQRILQAEPGVKNYADNVAITGTTIEEHHACLDRILQLLREHGLTLNRSKCKFAINSMNFLGYLISSKGIAMNEERIRALTDMKRPDNISELRGFLGLTNACSKFIPNLAAMTNSLRQLLKKGQSWHWTETMERAFNNIKQAVANNTLLAYFNRKRPTFLIVDASPYALGAVLAQQYDDYLRPIAFAHKALTDTEIKYAHMEKEALAVVWACEHFQLYLIGSQFTICTDHKPLVVIYSPNSRSSARVERWSLRLQHFNFKLIHIDGVNNMADPLSRLLRHNKTSDLSYEDLTETYVNFITNVALPKAITRDTVQHAASTDTEMKAIRSALITNNWTGEAAPYCSVASELTVIDNIVLRGNRIVVPACLRKQVLTLAHTVHQGITRTKSLLRTKVWWPGMDLEVSKLISNCITCQSLGQPNRPEPLNMTQWPDRPWSHLAIDICGPFPSGEYIIVLVDYHSKWPEAIITKDIKANKIIQWLDAAFTDKGYPDRITSDNGPQFSSETYKSYLSSIGVQSRFVTPYWPQANGLVERLNRVFLKAFRAAILQGKPWKEALNPFLMAYRTTPHVTTGKTLAYLLFRREFKTKLPSIERTDHHSTEDSLIRNKIHTAQNRQKEYADERRNAVAGTIHKGDKVLIKRTTYKNKLMSKFDPRPATVLGVQRGHLTLRTYDDIILYRNTNLVKKIKSQHLREDTREPNVSISTRERNTERSPIDAPTQMTTSIPIPQGRITRSSTGTVIRKPKRYT